MRMWTTRSNIGNGILGDWFTLDDNGTGCMSSWLGALCSCGCSGSCLVTLPMGTKITLTAVDNWMR
eukprot:9713992-Karenia_brevis.AAC.1